MAEDLAKRDLAHGEDWLRKSPADAAEAMGSSQAAISSSFLHAAARAQMLLARRKRTDTQQKALGDTA